MERYRLFQFVNRAGTRDAKMVLDADGPWVKYADLERDGLAGGPLALLEAMARLEAELKANGITMTLKLEKDDPARAEPT